MTERAKENVVAMGVAFVTFIWFSRLRRAFCPCLCFGIGIDIGIGIGIGIGILQSQF